MEGLYEGPSSFSFIHHLRSSAGAPLDLVPDGVPYVFGFVSESQQMVLEDHATRDTVRWVHQSDMHRVLTAIVSPSISPHGGLQINSLESFILSSQCHTPPNVSFLAQSCLSKLRHLELAGYTISSWDHLTSQTTLFTTLKLFFPDISPVPTMPRSLSILASNPHLQNLESNVNAIPDHDRDGSYQIPLRHLKDSPELWLDEVGTSIRVPQKDGQTLARSIPLRGRGHFANDRALPARLSSVSWQVSEWTRPCPPLGKVHHV